MGVYYQIQIKPKGSDKWFVAHEMRNPPIELTHGWEDLKDESKKQLEKMVDVIEEIDYYELKGKNLKDLSVGDVADMMEATKMLTDMAALFGIYTTSQYLDIIPIIGLLLCDDVEVRVVGESESEWINYESSGSGNEKERPENV